MHAHLYSSLGACRRKEPIIAIGGGVCLDVAGLSANLYRRNTPLIKVRADAPQAMQHPHDAGCCAVLCAMPDQM